MKTEELGRSRKSRIFIDEILKRHEPVLLDTSAIFMGNSYTHIMQHETYESIDRELIEIEMKGQELFSGVLCNTRVLTIPEVTREIAYLLKQLKEKKQLLDSHSHFSGKLEIGVKSTPAKNRSILEAICYNAEKMQELSLLSELRIEEPSYQILVNMVKLAEDTLHIKQRNSWKYGRDNEFAKKDSDEKLIAALYWICLNSETTPAIVTGDYDILRLVGVAYDIFPDSYFLPHNEQFRNAVLKTKPAVYMSDRDWIGWTRKFEIKNAKREAEKKYNSEKKQVLINRLLPFWKEFESALK